MQFQHQFMYSEKKYLSSGDWVQSVNDKWHTVLQPGKWRTASGAVSVDVNGYQIVTLPNSGNPGVATSLYIPDMVSELLGDTINITYNLCGDGSLSGDVRIEERVHIASNGTTVSAGTSSSNNSIITIPGTANQIVTNSLSLSTSFNPGDPVLLTMYRNSGNALDTYTGSCRFIGAVLKCNYISLFTP